MEEKEILTKLVDCDGTVAVACKHLGTEMCIHKIDGKHACTECPMLLKMINKLYELEHKQA